MKTLTKSIAAAALSFAMAAPASAAVSPNILTDINLAAGSGSNVRITVSGDTVTMYGFVEDTYALQSINRAAKRAGAKKVNNYVKRSR